MEDFDGFRIKLVHRVDSVNLRDDKSYLRAGAHVKRAKRRICLVSRMSDEQVERQYQLKTEVLAAKIKERGFSLASLADKLDVNVSTVRRWLKGGKAYMRNILPLAKALGVSSNELMEGYNPRNRIRITVMIDLASIDQTFESFLPETFIDALKTLISASDNISVHKMNESSFFHLDTGLDVSEGDAEKLMDAYQNGILDKLGITSVTYRDLDQDDGNFHLDLTIS
jgi:transcriptional regulator with XRE-family HTH domain